MQVTWSILTPEGDIFQNSQKVYRLGCPILIKIGPSGVHALPLAAGINVGGHSTWHYFSFSLLSSKVLTQNPRKVCRRVSNFCMGS